MLRWPDRVATAVDRTARAGSFLAGLAALVITLMITFDVAMRYFLNRPQIYVDELASFLQVLVIFWGLAYTFQMDGHVTVDLLTRLLKPRPRAGLRVVTLFLGLLFVAVFTWQTWEAALRGYRLGRVSTVMFYPLWIPQLFIPAGLALMFLAMVVALVREVGRLAKRDASGSAHGSAG